MQSRRFAGSRSYGVLLCPADAARRGPVRPLFVLPCGLQLVAYIPIRISFIEDLYMFGDKNPVSFLLPTPRRSWRFPPLP